MTQQGDSAAGESELAGDEVIRAFLGAIAAQDIDRISSLWADDGVIEFPFAPKHLGDAVPQRREGKAEITSNFSALLGASNIESHIDQLLPLRADGGYVVEYREHADMEDGRVFDAHFCAIVQVADGRLKHWREFFDPTAVLAAFGPPPQAEG